MDAQQKRQRGIILGIGGPIVVVFLLTQIAQSQISEGALLFVVAVLVVLFLVVRALVRVGDKRPEPVQVVQAAPQPTVAAGWYPDQVDPRYVRYFDGRQWTDALQPRM